MRTFGSREARLTIFATVLLLLLSTQSIMPPSFKAEGTPSRSLSNSGVVLIEDAASTVIYGREVYPEGDMVGSYVWSGDINGDGVDDIGFASTIDGENRGVNFIYGKKGGLPAQIDLAAPDSTSLSIAYPARQIDLGDANGDGMKDILLAGQLTGRYYSGTVSGFNLNNPGGLKSGIKQETWEYPYNDFIWAGDIDGDSIDDLVLGTFGCGGYLAAGIYQPDELNIYWSKSGNHTRLTADKWDDFTSSLDIGDIDGDGRLDMVVGVPRADPDPEESRQYGAVCIFFNITRFDNISLANPYLVADSLIYGSDQYDQFGWNVKLQDINGDGRDDIFAGAPNSGGVQNLKDGCGEIMIYYGKDNRSFPDLLDAENNADIIIIGALGSSSDPEYIGDKIGRTYQLSDMDGNGYLEILISTPYHLLPPLNDIPRENAGSLSMYELDKVIPKTGKLVTLGYPSKSFTLEGRDWGDTLGWQVSVGDINGDHFDDLLVGVPAADGYNNIRRNCGELYVINGEGTRLKDLRISGPGSSPPRMFTMGGAVEINVSFESTNGYGQVKGGRLTLGSGANSVSLLFDEGSFSKERDSYGSVYLEPEGCGFGGSGRNGWLRFRMELGWHFPFKGLIDLRFDLTDIEDSNITRIYPASALICKDIRMTDTLRVFTGSDELMTKGTYLAPETKVTLTDAAIVYKDDRQRGVPYGTLGINHFEGLFFSDDVPYSEGWSVDLLTPDEGSAEHSLFPYVDPDTYPGDLPSKYLPGTGAPLVYEVRVDGSAPGPPTGLKAVSKDGTPGNVSQTGEFTLSWDHVSFIDEDQGLSGVREYRVSVDDGEPVLSLQSGGLVGTYYSDLDSYQREKEVVDSELHFTVDDWGPFGPDPNLMLPYDYSIRWWGWMDMGDASNQFFKLLGSGDARLYMDGKQVMDWTPIGKGVVLGGYDFTAGERHRLEIVFRHEGGDSYFSFLYQDDSGSFSPVPSQNLFHPSHSHTMRVRSSQGTARVTAIDWVGHVSEPAELELYTDDTGPLFDISGIPRWVNVPAPKFDVTVWDADAGTLRSTGLDPATVMFRTQDDTGQLSDWSEPSRIKAVEDDPGKYIASVGLTLERNWNGEVQLTASDQEGNTGLSPWVEIGVDLRPPVITVLSPGSGETVEGSRVELSLRATDFRGSGFDGRTLRYKVLHNETWSDWRGIPFDVQGEELVLNETLDLPYGLVELVFAGSDLMGNMYQTPSFYLTLKVPVIDHEPVPVIKTPLNNSVYEFGIPVYLSSEGTSDDGIGLYSPVRLTWISSIQGLLGTRSTMDVILDPGEHWITLYADDGTPGHNVSVSVFVTVLEPPDDNGTIKPPIDNDHDRGWIGFLIVFFVMVLIVAAALIIMAVISKRRRGQQTQLWVISESDDDREYRSRKRHEDRERGYSAEDGDRPD